MTRYRITGMSCAACASRVERAASRVEGVRSCSVNLLTGVLAVEGDAREEDIVSSVKRAGYGIAREEWQPPERTKEKRDAPGEAHVLFMRLVVSVSLLLPLMYLSMGHVMWGLPLFYPIAGNSVAIGLLQLILSGGLLVINRSFFIKGVKGLLTLSPNMDTLVAIGSGVSYVYSTVLYFYMLTLPSADAMHVLHGLYFESAAMILALITLGKLLEAYARGRTVNAVRGLLSLSPETATLLRDGEEITVPVEELRVGDIFLLRAGERVPADGVVLTGESAVDESALTGESVPVDKREGDGVYTATVNKSGFLSCRATRVGADTTLSSIIRLVDDATATKAPISLLADRVSGIFVPLVMAISLLVTLIWLFVTSFDVGYSLSRGISVLVISCPCALGLATPVAIMVGSGVGARCGILFKTATALERMGRIKTAVLDKTGTLTQGEPTLTDVLSCGGEGRLLTLALSLEKGSEHPIGRAVVRYCEELGVSSLPAEGLCVEAGFGLRAKIDGCEVKGGNLAYVGEHIDPDSPLVKRALSLSSEGKTPIFFTCNGTLLGAMAVADTLREDSRAAVMCLEGLGVHTVMLTGDRQETAFAVARQVGIDRVIAEVRPDGKEGAIRALQAEGAVMMAGDGINDAPALASADVGVAVGTGTDIAIDSADVVLMGSGLRALADAIRLSRSVLRNIKENLFWAFFYNALCIPLAAGAFVALFGWELSPMLGAAAMSVSSLCVVLNALRLNFFRSDRDISVCAVSTEKKEKKMENAVFEVKGMMCPHCEGRVKAALEAHPAVEKAVASHKKGNVTVTLASQTDVEELKQIVRDQGYQVK